MDEREILEEAEFPERTCRICRTEDEHPHLWVREMMFGTLQNFVYFECSACGTVQIAEVPPSESVRSHYRPDYPGLDTDPPARYSDPILSSFRRWRDRHAVTGRGWIGRFLLWVFPDPVIRSLNPLKLHRTQRILDVGCGKGLLLYRLRELGFRNLLGVDPFLSEPVEYPEGDLPGRKGTLRIENGGLEGVEEEGTWDVIMLHHSFQRLPDPHRTLARIRELLADDGLCLIRIPLAGTRAWKRFGEHWVQLDPPRNLHLPTVGAMEQLTRDEGFTVRGIVFDSTAFQFWGSEQYRRGVSLLGSPLSYAVDPGRSVVLRGEMRIYRRLARRLNRKGEGDQAAFYLRKAT